MHIRCLLLLLTGYYNDQLPGINQSTDALIQTHYSEVLPWQNTAGVVNERCWQDREHGVGESVGLSVYLAPNQPINYRLVID